MKQHNHIPRRQFLNAGLNGFGSLALAGLLSREAAARSDLQTHHPPRAKSVIYLYMEGGPSQVDTFDYKPQLQRRDGQTLPFEKPATVFNSSAKLMRSPFEFQQHGSSGSWVSELLPNLATCVDDLTFIHSLHHEVSNHSAGCYMSHTGDPIAGRPSMGSWITYGLGSENDNLPGFVVLDCGQAPSGGVFTWSSGFLPAVHAGVKFQRGDVPVEFLNSLEPSPELQAAKLRGILELNHLKRQRLSDDQRIDSVIANYEKAARMQVAVPDVMDLSRESRRTQSLYGMDNSRSEVFGSRCLMARRLVERGVRFVELFSPRVKADRWDQHGGLKQGHLNNCQAVDKPIAALIKDLKDRGLLDETDCVVGRRVWPHADDPGRHGPGSQSFRLYGVSGGRRVSTGHALWRDGRVRVLRG